MLRTLIQSASKKYTRRKLKQLR